MLYTSPTHADSSVPPLLTPADAELEVVPVLEFCCAQSLGQPHCLLCRGMQPGLALPLCLQKNIAESPVQKSPFCQRGVGAGLGRDGFEQQEMLTWREAC